MINKKHHNKSTVENVCLKGADGVKLGFKMGE